MQEIGSEFSYQFYNENKKFIFPEGVKDFALTFSGRTSIESVLKNEPQIKKVMLPSYCCDSMIEPFRNKGIEVYFYDVNYKKKLQINIEAKESIDAILWCNYFGFNLKRPDFTKFIENNVIILEDITHSFYSKINQYNKQSHYLVASLRKWEPVLCGGYCASVKSELKYKPSKFPAEEYLEEKKRAMLLKKEYLEGNIKVNKDDFLKTFLKSNAWLSENYFGLTIDDESISILNHVDVEKNIIQRCNNAKELYKGLKDCKLIIPMFKEEDIDCPLFVPILVDKKNRDYVRKKLIENNIYCPVHWPKPNASCKSNLYDIELSLICDHRYNEFDMRRIIEVLKKCEENF